MKLLTFATAMMIAFYAETTSAELCDVRLQIQYNLAPGDLEEILRENGSIDVRGFIYRNGTWKVVENGTSLIGCPCLNQTCIQHCSNLDNETMQNSLNRTKHMVLDYHFWSIQNNTRKIVQINARRWKTFDLFKDFFVIEEVKYTEHRKYVQIDINDMSVEKSNACFAFNGNNEEIVFYEIDNSAIFTLTICCAVSITSLIVLLAAFAITGELKYFHGKSMFCHSITLMITYASFAVNYINNELQFEALKKKSAACYIIGYFSYYSFVCSFFWLNAIGFSFFRTFCKTSLRPSNDKKKFWRYSLYAWICPLLMTIALALNQLLYTTKDSFRASVGESVCYLNIKYNENFWCAMIYFYGPMLFLLVLNWGFFIATLSSIYKKQSDAGRTIWRIGRVTSRSSLKIAKFLMYTKLFVIMCGLWIMEFVSWALKDNYGIWHGFDAINCLGGLWLLICCVILSTRVRSRILKSVQGKFSVLKSTITIKSTRSTPSVSLRSPQRF